mmetsp:Transcript_26956/g.65473  ORF Transcript_26956/g.65473 Transcript_26956/m.65473 type:complete len:214 (-) Transcript_26956:1170-1811(-)
MRKTVLSAALSRSLNPRIFMRDLRSNFWLNATSGGILTTGPSVDSLGDGPAKLPNMNDVALVTPSTILAGDLPGDEDRSFVLPDDVASAGARRECRFCSLLPPRCRKARAWGDRTADEDSDRKWPLRCAGGRGGAADEGGAGGGSRVDVDEPRFVGGLRANRAAEPKRPASMVSRIRRAAARRAEKGGVSAPAWPLSLLLLLAVGESFDSSSL